MKKIIILFLIILSSLGIAFAQEYPDKLNNGKKLNKITDFRGIYENIYDDINHEDLVEVCERTLRWPEFWETNKMSEDTLIYSIKNCQNLRNRKTLTKFINVKNLNSKEFNIFWENFENRFKFERELLILENDMRRETGFSYIFSDGAEDRKDSPFDLISDLNEIDEIFFGEKAERPDLSYTKEIEKEITIDIDSETREIGLNQIEENHQPESPDFENYENNFSGNFRNIGIDILQKDLNSYALWTRYVGKTMFDGVDTDGVFTPSGFTAGTHGIPPLSSDKPESEELLYNSVPRLNSLNDKALSALNTVTTDSTGATIGINENLNTFGFAKDNIKSKTTNAINNFSQEILLFVKKEEKETVEEILKKINDEGENGVFLFVKIHKPKEIKRVLDNFQEELMPSIKDDKKKSANQSFVEFDKELNRLAINNLIWNTNQSLESFEKEIYRDEESQNINTNNKVLNQLKLDLDLFREGVNNIKDLFPSFLNKPQHSS